MRYPIDVVLDPGHGGNDPGACVPGLTEAEYNLCFANWLRLRIEHTAEPFRVHMLRRRMDDNPSLAERGRMSAELNADLVLSIHVNAHHEPHAHGGLCFHWPGNSVGGSVGDAISRAFPIPLLRRIAVGLPATDNPGPEDDWLQRPRNVIGPHKATAVLVELGFMTHAGDLAALNDEATKAGMIVACLAGLARFRQLYEAAQRAA